jgi:hypothetical protein
LRVDLARLRVGELIAAGGAAVLLVALFGLTWPSVGPAPGQPGHAAVDLNGWSALPTGRWLLLIAIALSLVLPLVTAARRSPALPIIASVVTAVVGVLATVLVLYRLVDHPGAAPATAEVGIYVGLVGAAAIAYGGYRSMRSERSPVTDTNSIEIVRLGAPGADPGGGLESRSAGRTAP